MRPAFWDVRLFLLLKILLHLSRAPRSNSSLLSRTLALLAELDGVFVRQHSKFVDCSFIRSFSDAGSVLGCWNLRSDATELLR